MRASARICRVSVAAAAAGRTALGIGIANRETCAVVRVIDELDDTWLKGFHGISIAEEIESLLVDDHLSLGCLLLEGHPELGSGACHAYEVDLDTVTFLFVLRKEIIDEFLGFRCYCNHTITVPVYGKFIFKLSFFEEFLIFPECV